MNVKDWRNWQVPIWIVLGIAGYQVWAFCNTFYSSNGRLDSFSSMIYWGVFASLWFYPAAYVAVFEIVKRVKARTVEKTKVEETTAPAVFSTPKATESQARIQASNEEK